MPRPPILLASSAPPPSSTRGPAAGPPRLTCVPAPKSYHGNLTRAVSLTPCLPPQNSSQPCSTPPRPRRWPSPLEQPLLLAVCIRLRRCPLFRWHRHPAAPRGGPPLQEARQAPVTSQSSTGCPGRRSCRPRAILCSATRAVLSAISPYLNGLSRSTQDSPSNYFVVNR